MQMVMTLDETQIQSFADCLMSQAKRVRGEGQQEKSRLGTLRYTTAGCYYGYFGSEGLG